MLSQELVNWYYEKNEEKKKVEKELKEANKEIKKTMKELGEDKHEVGDLVVEIKKQDRGKMDEEGLGYELVAKGLKEAVEFKPVPIPEKIEELILNEQLEAEDVNKHYKQNFVEALTIKKKKGRKRKTRQEQITEVQERGEDEVQQVEEDGEDLPI